MRQNFNRNNFNNDHNSFSNKNNKRGLNRSLGANKGKFSSIIVIIIIIVVVFYGMANNWLGKYAFYGRSDSSQGVNKLNDTLNNSTNKSADKIKHDRNILSDEEFKATEVYNLNPIITPATINKQIPKVYAVFAYTKDVKLDKPFIDWVNDHKDIKGQVFEINEDNLVFDNSVQDYINVTKTDKDGKKYTNKRPVILIYRFSQTKNVAELTDAITNKDQLKKVGPYLKEATDKSIEELGKAR